MHPEHDALLDELRLARGPVQTGPLQNDSYGGSGRPFYNVAVPVRRAIVRRWLADRKSIPVENVKAVVESLFAGESHEEKTLAAILLACRGDLRRQARPGDVERWLGQLNGWAEVDCLCAGLFTAEDMAGDWGAWTQLIGAFAHSPDVNRRRAALVLLTGPVRRSSDPRLAAAALGAIEVLRTDKAPLITKAVSWLLRSMVGRHRPAVESLLARGDVSLPAIAVRETRAKLATGVKTPRRRVEAPQP